MLLKKITINQFKKLLRVETIDVIRNPKNGKLFVAAAGGRYRCQQDIDYNKEMCIIMEGDDITTACLVNTYPRQLTKDQQIKEDKLLKVKDIIAIDKNKINEEFVIVLKQDYKLGNIYLDFIRIQNEYEEELLQFQSLLEESEYSSDKIIAFFSKTLTLNKLDGVHHYCEYLDKGYQRFTVDIPSLIEQIKERYESMLKKKKQQPDKNKYDYEKDVQAYKSALNHKFTLWIKSHRINEIYKQCKNNQKVLTYSHRIDGWADPVHKLNNYFSVQLKTNFGFGYVSYFYTVIKYKDIEITPFSEWITYEKASFSEIVRYSQCYQLENSEWLEALTYAMDACNLSIRSENEFVKKYIIDDCEIMVKGLEEIFNKESFSFKNRDHSSYGVDKKGHALVDFRGEKISGALDFISKILEFKGIVKIESFIQRIEQCNLIIQPILVNEIIEIMSEINKLEQEMIVLKLKYEESKRLNNDYVEKRKVVKARLIIERTEEELDSHFENLLSITFNIEFPEFKSFTVNHEKIKKEFRLLTERISNLLKVLESIKGYNERITNYFKNKTVLPS